MQTRTLTLISTLFLCGQLTLLDKLLFSEARSVAKQYNCKYIETSAALNHHVDELLVGILSQIRIKQTPGFVMEVPSFEHKPREPKAAKCTMPGPKKLLNYIFKKQTCKVPTHECEDLFT